MNVHVQNAIHTKTHNYDWSLRKKVRLDVGREEFLFQCIARYR